MSHFVSTKQLIQSPQNKGKDSFLNIKCLNTWSNISTASAEETQLLGQNFHLDIIPGSMIWIFKSLLNQVKKFRSILI